MQNIAHDKNYSALRGGHAPGDLRKAFADACDAYMATPSGAALPTVEFRGQSIDLRSLAGLLWNCRDIAPGHLCQTLADLAHWTEIDAFNKGGKTYAQCARLVRLSFEKQEAA
ncbi:MAG: hypothetical protein DI537_34360 [Stutzerimonas stutzeri]|nr:MAG: hypothetical protein DI537_34360 [Stutzerimonas stutzeri]